MIQPNLTIDPRALGSTFAPQLRVTGLLAPNDGPALRLAGEFVAAATSSTKVAACPHDLYKYPARFAPVFAAAAIKTFSQPEDVILDPFCGGGTTLIEATRLGRRAVGYDVSALACFLARAKSTSLTIHDERQLISWGTSLRLISAMKSSDSWDACDTDDGYYRRNLPEPALEFFAAIIGQLDRLQNSRSRRFARLVLLAVGQWALDCKTAVPTADQMLERFRSDLMEKVRAFRDYTRSVAHQLGVANRDLDTFRSIKRESSERCGDCGNFEREKAGLVVTSPPYPGVHMLYHRWQIQGRRETPAPFLLANCRDGDGISYYCLGNRHEDGLKTYYRRLTNVFTAVRRCIREDALVIQMVAFNQPQWQLPTFLDAMERAGFVEQKVDADQLAPDGRLWRQVPGRRWYASVAKHTNAAGKEVVLFHRPVAS